MSLTLDAVSLGTVVGSSAGPPVVMSAIVDQPSEVDAQVDAATRDGATVIKAGKKGLFGGYHATYRTADGIVWKVSSERKKDSGPASVAPTATETIAILGVAEPKTAKGFYEALGMAVDRDYGNKFVDFALTPTRYRLGLMPPKDLAKDTGVADGALTGHVVLVHRALSAEEVDAVIAAAVAAGARLAAPAESGTDTHEREFSDPYGFRWKVTTA